MPNLVGIGNSQAPTNAMLGGLAYQDSVGEIDIDKIKVRTSDTAVDIFVYDTRKDSDGGAWRHRTQNTSWYNEGVSELRGARKEFPAVAVLVLEHLKLTIYDGDDPNMPMWMIFPTIANQQNMIAGFNDHDLKTVAALNGIIVVGSSPSWNHGNIVKVNFIKDDAVSIAHTNDKKWTGGIINRNTDDYWQNITSGNYILTNHVKDVAMTVMPNAPIDDVTGLPISTIAVACSGGVSVIQDNGAVSNLTPGGGVEMNSVSFDKNNNLVMGRNNFILYRSDHPHYLSNQVDNGYTVTNRKITAPSVGEDSSGSTSFTDVVGISDSSIAFDTQTLGLGLYDVNAENNSNSMVAYIRATHNTGWMHGGIKGAFLSDTDDTDITATSLTSNWATVGNWTVQTQRLTLASDGAGGLNLTHSDQSGSYVYAFLPFTVEANTDYIIYVEMTAYHSNGLFVHTAMYAQSGSTVANLHAVPGTFKSVQFNSGSNTTLYLHFNHNSTTATNIKNVVAQKVTDGASDRSVNAKDLLTFGTITRTHVATGAELVAYNGFSTSNYLFQPYNSDLQFGTSNYSIMLWYKGVSGSTGKREIFAEVTGSSASFWLLHKEYTNKFVFDSVTDPNTYSENVWYHLAGVRESGNARLYVNGELVGSAASGDNITDTSLGLIIGQDSANNDWRTRGSLALLKISASAPTEEQIKKIYNDEKCLYHENAKCTLHGTSNNVKALAFDDTNGVLHVGTSAGRSEFQGLNRINNTTTAVTTAISASNELVAEQ